MDTIDWSRAAARCSVLVHEISALMALLAPRSAGAPPAGQALAGARAAEAAHQLLEALAGHPEFAAGARAVMRLQGALHAWQRAIRDNSPIGRRYQIALMQQAATAMSACLHVESHALQEWGRMRSSARFAAPSPVEPGLH